MNFARALCAIACLATFALRASASESPLTARLTCQRASGPGRIVCELSTRANAGRLVWSDALVVRAPDFARPLRSRVVAQLEPSGRGGAFVKFALVAGEQGQGKLELLARGVVCSNGASGEWCAPEVVPVTALIEVGPALSP